MRSVLLAAVFAIGCASHTTPTATPPHQGPAVGSSPLLTSSFRDPATGQWVSGPGILGPKAIYAPVADFPAAASRDRAAGDVLMDVVVDATGKVISVMVTKSVRADVDGSATATVKGWRFEAAQKGGTPVAALITVSMSFNVK